MGYKRANWHSGLTYVQTCEECKHIVQYTDFQLGFRPWYPDGFVYCTRCQTPLRHHERYAISSDQQPNYQQNVNFEQSAPAENAQSAPVDNVVTPPPQTNSLAAFCTGCGKKFNDEDRFCSGCGKKRT